MFSIKNNLSANSTISDEFKEEVSIVSAKPKRKNVLRKVLQIGGIVILMLALIAGAIYLWALMSTDSSLTARGIMWGDAKADDWRRYPSRELQASAEPHYFQNSTASFRSEMTIDGKPLETYLEETNTTAFILLHGDELLYEGYFNSSSREATQASLSAAKSFASTLVGIALEEGYISSLDDPITAYIPELTERDRRFEQITLRHLITMSSGLRFVRDEANPFSDDFITYASPDLRVATLDSQIAAAPGQQFHYNDYNPLLLGMALERATGMPVSEYLETRLWAPMGAEGDGSWDLDSESSGFEKMAVGLNGRAIDLVKLGWLFLNRGATSDKQVVPATWVEEATRVDTTSDPAGHYQYYWWVDEAHQAYYAEGNFCQYIYVYPAADLVMLRTGSDCGGGWYSDMLGDMAAAFAEELE